MVPRHRLTIRSIDPDPRAAAIQTAARQLGLVPENGLEGKVADLVILEKDPRNVDPDTIKDIKVLETWMDGKQVYRA